MQRARNTTRKTNLTKAQAIHWRDTLQVQLVEEAAVNMFESTHGWNVTIYRTGSTAANKIERNRTLKTVAECKAYQADPNTPATF